MGWLCPHCGAENDFSIYRCRACGVRAGGAYRAWERLCSSAEHWNAGPRKAPPDRPPLDTSRPMVRGNRVLLGCLLAILLLCLVVGISTGVAAAREGRGASADSVSRLSIRLRVESVIARGKFAALFGQGGSSSELKRALNKDNAASQWTSFKNRLHTLTPQAKTSALKRELDAARQTADRQSNHLSVRLQYDRRVSRSTGESMRRVFLRGVQELRDSGQPLKRFMEGLRDT